MVPIRARPLLDYWLELLVTQGIERVLVNTHHLPAPVRRYVAASAWHDRVDLVHENELLGTGGTILHNRAYFDNEPFLVAHGDNLTRFNVHAMMERHRTRPPLVEITMMTFDTDTPRSCGIIEEDERGVVVAFHEKVPDPPGSRANGAVYILEPSIVAFLAELGSRFIDFSTEILPHYLGRIVTFHNAGYHRDIGAPDSLQRAEAEF